MPQKCDLCPVADPMLCIDQRTGHAHFCRRLAERPDLAPGVVRLSEEAERAAAGQVGPEPPAIEHVPPPPPNPFLALIHRANACPDADGTWLGCGCNQSRRCRRFGRSVARVDCLRCVAGEPG
jgi:hypothetical protein